MSSRTQKALDLLVVFLLVALVIAPAVVIALHGGMVSDPAVRP